MQGKCSLCGSPLDPIGVCPNAGPQDLLCNSEVIGISLETMAHPASCNCTVCITVARMEFQLIDA